MLHLQIVMKSMSRMEVKSTDVTGSGVSASHPEMTRFSGQILYVENRGAVSSAADQIEDIKLIIEM